MIIANIKDIDLKFETSEEVFSPKSIDRGTLAMLSTADFNAGDRILDLGCGYGVVGILAAKITGPANVVMTDKDIRAVELSRRNAAINNVEGITILQSDGFKSITQKDFTLILSNPPYHEDFSVPREFIEKGFNRLSLGGRLYMVTKRKEWYKNKLTAIFGGVRIWEVDNYFVFMSIKKDLNYARRR